MLIAAAAAMTFVSCNKIFEPEFLNPQGTPVQFTLSGDKAFKDNKANIKVTASVAVPVDMKVSLSLNSESNIKPANIILPSLVIKAGSTEAAGEVQIITDGLKPATTFEINIIATVAGAQLGQKVALTYTTEKEPEPPVAGAITIDGDMSDWKDITGVHSEDGPIYDFKAACDKDNIYFYAKREVNDPALWGGGYYYFDIDIDSNPSTGVEKDAIAGLETYMFLYFFKGTAESPEIPTAPAGEYLVGGTSGSQVAYTCAANSCKGKINEDNTVEIEIKLPLADLGLKSGDDTTIYTWGNKSGSNLKTTPLYLKIK